MKRSDLGLPITRYNIKELGWKDLLRVFLPLTVLVLLPVSYGFWRTLYGYSNFGPAAAAAWGRNWFLLGAGLVLLLLLYSLSRLRKAHTWIEVYRWGLLFHLPPGKKRILEWKEIKGITSYSVKRSFLSPGSKIKEHLILYSRGRSPIRCHPNLKNLGGLKKIIKKQVYGRLNPVMIQAFNNGEILPFGEIRLSKQALFMPTREIPWEIIEGINVHKGIFIVKLSEQKNLETPIRKIQNLEILVHLIRTEI